jgi:hypothetical protein
MPQLGYDRWESFADAIDRAKAAARNSGNDPEQAFSGLREKATGGRPRDDYRLTRFGAYLLAMNGDPRKPQIASAQSYFAVKTREAEVAAPPAAAPLSFEGRMRVLQMATGLVDATWLETKVRHTVARALGEEPEVDASSMPLTVGEYLGDLGLSGAALRSASTRFGRHLKALYRETHNREPGLAPRFVDGTTRQVAAYTEADRPLFDAVWAQHYAPKLAVAS